MHTAALSGIVEKHIFRSGSIYQPAAGAGSLDHSDKEPSPSESFSLAQAAIRDVLTYRGGFLRLEATESAETGYWWLKDPSGSALPAADRLEKALVAYLLRHPGCSFLQLETALNTEFPGLLTPDLELINVCLDSYAVEEPPGSDCWRLRPQESPAARRQDLETAHEQLKVLAVRLGYRMEGQPPVWIDEKGVPRYWFYLIASAVIGEIILGTPDAGISSLPPSPASSSIIILPGGRANLVAYKLRHDPRLRALCDTLESPPPSTAQEQAVTGGWRFLKFRHLRQMIDNVLLNRSHWEDILAQDGLTYTAPQMRLF
jgi:hypothetical protein